MKFSFSTLACPDYTWADIYSMAKDLGFDGIEVRGLGNDIFDASKNMPFSPRLLPATKQKLRALRLTIPCLSSGCCLRDGATVETVAEVRAYIEAAESIGTPYVRVLGDLNPAPDGDVDDEAVLAALRALLPYACLLYTLCRLPVRARHPPSAQHTIQRRSRQSTSIRRPSSGIDHPAT